MEAARPSSAAPIAPVVVLALPDISMAGLRAAMSLGESASSRTEWKVEHKDCKGTRASAVLRGDNSETESGHIIQYNFGDDDNKAEVTFLAVNAGVQARCANLLAKSIMSILSECGVSSLILPAALRVDNTIPAGTGLQEGSVAFATWNGHQKPKRPTEGTLDMKQVGERVSVSDPLISAVLHFSLVFEIPTLGLFTRGYKIQGEDSVRDGTQAVAFCISRSVSAALGAGTVQSKVVPKASLDAIRRIHLTKEALAANKSLFNGKLAENGHVDNRQALYL